MKNSALSKEKRAKRALTIFFAVLCVFYVMPVLLVLLNSFKVNTFVKTDTFGWPSGESFAGWSNFVKGMTFGNYPFWKSALYSTVITILSTAPTSGTRCGRSRFRTSCRRLRSACS